MNKNSINNLEKTPASKAFKCPAKNITADALSEMPKEVFDNLKGADSDANEDYVEAITDLADTASLMSSSSYKKRFIAEYFQTKIRYEKLKAFCNKIEAAYLEPNLEAPYHDCPYELLRDQQRAMGEYLHILELRAIIEKIDL